MATTTMAPPPARAPKFTQADIDRFKAIKAKVTDAYENSLTSIEANATLKLTAALYGELDWLCDEVVRFGGPPADDADRFGRTADYFRGVCATRAAAVKGGRFVDAGARVWKSARFLVRCLDAALGRALDAEDRFLLGDRLPANHEARVEVPLDDAPDEGE